MQQVEPSLCTAGCGFFGAPQTNGLCSKCFKELQPPPDPLESKTSSPEPATEFVEKHTKKNRCFKCNIKIRLGNRFVCKCTNLYCPQHRSPLDHECEYDYKGQARSRISAENPVIKSDKIDKI